MENAICPCGTGKTFLSCHGFTLAPQPIEMASSTKLVKLDLACGQNPREGFEGVDLYAPNAQKVDLTKFPWPWHDNSVDELHCSHYVEHIPAREVEERDIIEESFPINGSDGRWCEATTKFIGQDHLFAFFDEAWRILKPGGNFKVIWPALKSSRAFQDPTHRRYIPDATMLYLDSDWRKAQKLDHYRVKCDFIGRIAHTFSTDFNALHDEVRVRKFTENWDCLLDFHADLVARKP